MLYYSTSSLNRPTICLVCLKPIIHDPFTRLHNLTDLCHLASFLSLSLWNPLRVELAAAAVLGSPNAQGKPAQHIHRPLGGRTAPGKARSGRRFLGTNGAIKVKLDAELRVYRQIILSDKALSQKELFVCWWRLKNIIYSYKDNQ